MQIVPSEWVMQNIILSGGEGGEVWRGAGKWEIGDLKRISSVPAENTRVHRVNLYYETGRVFSSRNSKFSRGPYIICTWIFKKKKKNPIQ